MDRIAVYTGTRNIYSDMETAAKSLVANSAVDKIHFFTEDEEFPSELPPFIEVHNASKQEFFPPNGPNMKSKFTYMAMIRIAMCHLLPDAERALVLDCDTFAQRDCTPVFDLPISDCYLAASSEWHRSKNGLLYCNFGVVLYNLDKMRDGKADECIDTLNRRGYPWVEQDVGSYLCQGHIFDMPTTYNSNHWTDNDKDDNPCIVHYAGMKRDEWIDKPLVKRYRSMTWDEALARHADIFARYNR